LAFVICKSAPQGVIGGEADRGIDFAQRPDEGIIDPWIGWAFQPAMFVFFAVHGFWLWLPRATAGKQKTHRLLAVGSGRSLVDESYEFLPPLRATAQTAKTRFMERML
jgi:hypothetical protein